MNIPSSYKLELNKISEHDIVTRQHGERVGNFAYFLMMKITNGNEIASNTIKKSGKLHDIGKLYIPIEILEKTGPLTNEERDIIENHCDLGYTHVINKKQDFYDTISKGILEHHERYDGSGYPRRLKGEEISLCGRVLAVCDVTDALLSKRSYKNSWIYEDVKEYMISHKGTLFDPKLVDLFFENDDVKEVIEVNKLVTYESYKY